MDSSNSDRELVAKIGHSDAPEAGSRRMPGFSAINAAGDADGGRTTVAPSVTVANGLENARHQSGMPHPFFFRICRGTSAKRARVAVSRMLDAKLHGSLTREAAAAAAAATISCPCRVPCDLGLVSCVLFRVFGCLCLLQRVLTTSCCCGGTVIKDTVAVAKTSDS